MIEGRVSVIVPGRKEKFFQKTIDDILRTAESDIEIIAIVDGEEWETPLIHKDARVKILRLENSIGQRAAYNLGVRNSSGQFVMKIDAHCMLSHGFDVALKEVYREFKAQGKEKLVILPEMRRLDPHLWKCKRSGETLFMNFGIDLYCHYWPEYGSREGVPRDNAEVMTGQGSAWFTTREYNDFAGLLDEGVGSWGNVGIEISLRTWLCGGTQISTKKAWQAHYFRKDEGGFPYHLTGRHVHKAHKYTYENYYFNDNAFKNQCRPFKWIIEKFAPVPQWEAYLSDQYKAPRVLLYYTHSELDEALAGPVRKRIEKMRGPIPLYTVSQKPLNWGKNICVGDKPKTGNSGYKSMYEQIKAGLEAIPDNSIVYLLEHDVFYHPSHFAKLPKSKNHVYFNTNRYYWKPGMNGFYKARGKRAMSQGVAYKNVWLNHVKERLAQWERGEKTKMRIPFYNFESERPNVDIRHGANLTPDGHYKKKHELGQLANTGNLPGWGGVKHFMSVTGYKPEPITIQKVEKKKMSSPTQPIDAQEWLLKKFKKVLPQVSPVRCRQFKRRSFGNMFAQMGLNTGVEIGVRQGHFSEILCKCIPDLTLSCVDIWGAYYHFDKEYGQKNLEICKKRLAPYNVEFINAPSVIASMEFPDNSLDFVYIDADHRFDYVMEDIIAWSRKVRPGGIVSGHDYYRFRNAGVVPAVDVYTQQHEIKPWFITDEKEASFFWVKPEPIDEK